MTAPRRGTRAVVLAAMFVAAGALVSATAGAQTDPTAPAPPPPKPVEKTVDTGDNFYKPKKLKIRVGTTVEWENTGRSLHNVVPNKGDLFGVSRLAPGKSYRYTFGEPGKFKYYCSFHGAPNTGQWGTIVVKP